MAIHKTGGAKFYVSPTSVSPDTIEDMSDGELLAFYQGISDWIEVEELENLGDVGDTAEAISFTTINRNRVRKLKGPRNAGTQTVVVGRDPLDDGQEQLIVSEQTEFNYPFRILLNDARSAAYTQSELFHCGMVTSRPTNMGPNAQVTTRTFAIEINTSVLEVASVEESAPTNTLLPSISGIAQVGETLTAIEGTWTGNPAFTYQWEEDDTGWVAISGATSKTYVVGAGVEGNGLRVTVTGTNGAGTADATSAETSETLAE